MDHTFRVLDTSEAIAILTLALLTDINPPGNQVADCFLCLAEAGEDIPGVMQSLREVRKKLKVGSTDF